MGRARPLHAVFVILLTLPPVVPLLRPGWIQSHEGLSYPIRQVEVARCWQDGLWSARWFPDLNYGQGYPFLAFYAPLLFYASGTLHAAGVPVDLALKLVVAAATLLGAAGAWRLARLATGPAGAAIAAALYTYAPYHVRDVFIRGDLAEYLAMGFLPWCLFAVARLVRRDDPVDAAPIAVTGAAVILSHNILGLLTGVMMAATATVTVVATERRVRAGAIAVAGGIGALLLTAFFWGPALHERQFVRIDVLTSGHYVVERHFATWVQLLGRGEAPGVGQELPMTFEIGWVALAAALLAPFAWREGDRRRRLALAIGAILTLGGILMTTSLGAPVYRAVPLLQFVQFPWRFLAWVALGTALSGGIAIGARIEGAGWRRSGAAVIGVSLAALLLVAPLLGPKRNFRLPDWSMRPEELRETRETTTRGEYQPRWVTSPERPRGFENGLKVLGNATMGSADRRAGRYAFTIAATETVTVVLRDVYYPGWMATTDAGESIALMPQEGTGRATLALGPGRHEVRVRLEPTRFRRACRGVSAAAAVLVIVAAGMLHGRRRGAGGDPPRGDAGLDTRSPGAVNLGSDEGSSSLAGDPAPRKRRGSSPAP